MQRPLLGAALALTVIATGCHAGAGGASGIPSVPSYLRPANLHPATSNASVVLTVPPGAANPKGLGGLAYANWLNHGTPVAQFAADVSPKSTSCTTAGGTRTCTVPVSIPVGGPYEIVVSTYSVIPVNGTFRPGTQIGSGLVAAKVGGGSANRIALTTARAIAAATIAVQPRSVRAIDPATLAAIVTGYDASGNSIVADAFTSAAGGRAGVRVTADSLSHFQLSIAPSSLTSPGSGAIVVTYSSSKARIAQIAKGFTATLTATPSVAG